MRQCNPQGRGVRDDNELQSIILFDEGVPEDADRCWSPCSTGGDSSVATMKSVADQLNEDEHRIFWTCG